MSVYTKVVDVLSESLAVEPGNVTPESNLLTDLGAESIDLLDVVFRLEREFGIEIPRGELFPDFLFRSTGDFVEDGRLTDAGRRQVAEAFVHRYNRPGRTTKPRELFTDLPPTWTGRWLRLRRKARPEPPQRATEDAVEGVRRL
jgi:acyl carrier protein